MADVFGRQDQLLMGGLSSDSLFMSWPELAATGGGLGMLIQRVSIDYMQPLRRIFEIGPGIVPINVGGGQVIVNGDACDSPAGAVAIAALGGNCNNRTQPTYYIVGRPEGGLQASHFVGPQALSQCFYRKYGSPCGPNVISLSGRAGCDAADAASHPYLTWQLNGVVANRMGMDVSGQEMVIQEGFSAMVSGLNVLINGLDPVCDPQLVAGP